MKSTRMLAVAAAASLGALLLVVAGVPSALRADVDCEECCDDRCPDCGGVCRPIPTTKTVSDHCWRVEWKRVCIPAVQPPWARWWRNACDCEGTCDGSCEEARCGRVRWVRVLVKEKRERKVCTCEWVIDTPCDDCTPSSGVALRPTPASAHVEFGEEDPRDVIAPAPAGRVTAPVGRVEVPAPR